jgi:hypothetical protein
MQRRLKRLSSARIVRKFCTRRENTKKRRKRMKYLIGSKEFKNARSAAQYIVDIKGEHEYGEVLSDIYDGVVIVCGKEYPVVYALRKVDEARYQKGLADWRLRNEEYITNDIEEMVPGDKDEQCGCCVECVGDEVTI